MKNYNHDSRSIAKHAKKFLKDSKIADDALFSPEPKSFIFDNIYFKNELSGGQIIIDNIKTIWNNDRIYKNVNKRRKQKIKSGYAPVPPIDSSHNLRSTILLIMNKIG